MCLHATYKVDGLHAPGMSRTKPRNHEGEGIFLTESIKAGLKTKLLSQKALQSVIVDSTVQPKNIRFPTDARLYDRLRERLVAEAQKLEINLRQTYSRVGKKELRKNGGYAKAHQMKRLKKSTNKLKTYLRRVTEDIKRKVKTSSKKLECFLKLADRLLLQQRKSKDKIYSIHEPDVACIAKGKSGKAYEFGSKVSVVSTVRGNWIVAAVDFMGNPYDGHTLNASIQACEQITQVHPQTVVCDLGYRKHDYTGSATIHIANRFAKKRPSRTILKLWRRRNAIKPIIGHLKSEHRIERNYLSGKKGDEANIILAAVAFNMRKFLRAFAHFCLFLFRLSKKHFLIIPIHQI